MRLASALAATAACVVLAGCATSATDLAPDRADRPWAAVTTEKGEIVPGGAAESARGGATGPGYVLPANPDLAAPPASFGAEAGKAYTLPELIDIAESSNPMTRIAWNDARRVALAAGIAESAYLPKITASAVGAYQTSNGNDTAAGVSVNGGVSGGGTISALSLDWLLFDFGEREAVVEAAKQASVVSNIAFTAAHQQVIYGVSLAFYDHAAAAARLVTATQSLKNAESVEAAADDRSRHGIGTAIEVAQAHQGTAQERLALVEATGGAQDSYLTLLSAMGISPLTKLAIADVSNRKLSPELDTPVETIVAEALSRRPDVLGAFAAEKASLAKVDAARADFLPKFFLSATGAYNSGGLAVTALPLPGQQSPTVNIAGSHLTGSVLAGLTVPLYDGGTRAAILAQAHSDAENADTKLTKVKEDAVRQIALADNALRTSLAAHGAALALVDAAQTTFDAALTAYRSGVGSITDLNLAETQLLQAKNAETDTYSTALSAAASLALSTGALGASPE